MSRPADWTPLHEGDPVPGDVAVVRAEGTRLSRTAVEIEDQVAVLRRIAAGEGLSGDYVTTLHDGATDSADRLSRLTNRYREVGATLTTYAPQLEVAQEQSVTLLRRAQEAQARADANARAAANTVIPDSAADDADEATKTKTKAAIEDAEGARRRLQQEADTASAEVAAERARLRDVMAQRDRDAEAAAAAIRRAVDDSVTDSWWDNYKEWVHDNAGWLSTAATVAGAVGLVIAVVGIIVVAGPVAAVLAAVGLVLAAGALLIHSVLASAGEGSWADVGLDVIGLATFGLGKGIGPGLKFGKFVLLKGGAKAAMEGLEGATRSMALVEKGLADGEKLMRVRLGRDVIEGTGRSLIQRLSRLSNRGGPGSRYAGKALQGLRGQLGRIERIRIGNVSKEMRELFSDNVVTTVSERISVGGVDADLAAIAHRVDAVVDAYPNIVHDASYGFIRSLGKKARILNFTSVGSGFAGVTADLVNIATGKPLIGWGQVQQGTKITPGSTW